MAAGDGFTIDEYRLAIVIDDRAAF